SYGGHMTLVTATQYNGPICCSVDVVGISNLATFLEHTSGYRQDLRRVEYGDERDSTLRLDGADRPAQQRRQGHEAALHRSRHERSSGAAQRGRADGRGLETPRGARVVSDGQGRGPRLPQEGEPGLPVLRHDSLHRALPARG